MAQNITNRTKQAQATKNKIFEVGIKLLRRKGFDQVNVALITKMAGVSVGTFYHYFDSKLDLFMDIYRSADKYFEEDIPSKLEGKNFFDKILFFFHEYAALGQRDGLDLIKKIYIPENKLFLTRPRAMHDLLLKIIQEGQLSGEISNHIAAEDLRDSLFLVGRGVIYDWALRDGSYDLFIRMKDMISRILLTYKS